MSDLRDIDCVGFSPFRKREIKRDLLIQSLGKDPLFKEEHPYSVVLFGEND
jgi:hypothetical protein